MRHNRFLYYYWENLAFRAVIGCGRLLRYEQRLQLAGTVARRAVVASGRDRCVLENLEFIFPEMSENRRQEILKGCSLNLGKFFAETYSSRQFVRRAQQCTPEGPGFDLIRDASAQRRPIILVSGHFGNFQAVRALLPSYGIKVGAIYKTARNPFFNRHYEQTITAIGTPIFQVGKDRTGLVRFIKGGGAIGWLNDQYASGGETLKFMGKPARTNTLVAKLALRYDALMIPCYGTRRKNGIDFRTEFEAPVPVGEPLVMTQHLNDSLEARVRKDPEQYHWFHRRWKDSLSPNRSSRSYRTN